MTQALASILLSATEAAARAETQALKDSEWERLTNCEACDYFLESVHNYDWVFS